VGKIYGIVNGKNTLFLKKTRTIRADISVYLQRTWEILGVQQGGVRGK